MKQVEKYIKVRHLFHLEKHCKRNGLDIEIYTGKKCVYCGNKTTLVDDEFVYGTDYGNMHYLCMDCQAWCGCHKGTDIGLGTVANKELRKARGEAHKYFDVIWQKAVSIKGMSKRKARKSSYKWLSYQMGIDVVMTHIGMMTLEQCKEVVRLSKPYYNPRYVER